MFNQTNELKTVMVNGQEITYDIHGDAEGPVILLLTGWCQDYRLFNDIVQPLAQEHKVLRINWRGHHNPQGVYEDFGVNEQAEDVIGVLDALGIDQVIPVSTSHGGWANMEITQRLGVARVPRTIVIDWILIEAGDEFITSLQESQDTENWMAARQGLFDYWIGMSNNAAVKNHVDNEMGAFGYDLWARSCRVIENAYRTWSSPLKRMSALDPQRPVLHIYSQGPVAKYAEIQQQFSTENPWFAFNHIVGGTHFPTLESPETVVKSIKEFISKDA